MLSVRKLDKVVRDADVRDDGVFYGPAPEDDCPCGSRRQAQRCHRASDHSWVAERPHALLTDARTRYAKRGSYARCRNAISPRKTGIKYEGRNVIERRFCQLK